MSNPATEHKILRNYQYSSIILGSSFCLFYAYFDAWINFIGPGIFLLFVLLSIILEQSNRHKPASIILVLSLWSAPAWCMLFSGGIYSPLLIWMTPTIFMAGILLDKRWALFVGALSVTNIVISSFFIETLINLNEFQSESALNILFILSSMSSIGLITFYGYTFTKELTSKVISLQDKENELINHRNNLELLVDKKSLELIHSRDDAIQANDAKSDFLSNMSHELRTPMNAILGFAQMLKLDNETFNETQRDNVQEIIFAGDHLISLINGLLDFSKIEAGKLDIQLEDVALDDLLKQSIILIQSQANKRQLSIDNNVYGKSYILLANALHLKQVFLNLLSNAVKYNSEQGNIKIDDKIMDNNILRVFISDTGDGIKEEEMSKLFTPFERINTEKYVEGTGIGLVIAKELIEHMGGTIGVISEVGKGTTFWIDVQLKD